MCSDYICDALLPIVSFPNVLHMEIIDWWLEWNFQQKVLKKDAHSCSTNHSRPKHICASEVRYRLQKGKSGVF